MEFHKHRILALIMKAKSKKMIPLSLKSVEHIILAYTDIHYTHARVMLQAPVDDQKEVNSHTGNTHTINNLTKNVD